MDDEYIGKYVNFEDFKTKYILEYYVSIFSIDTEEKMIEALKDGSVIIISYGVE